MAFAVERLEDFRRAGPIALLGEFQCPGPFVVACSGMFWFRHAKPCSVDGETIAVSHKISDRTVESTLLQRAPCQTDEALQ